MRIPVRISRSLECGLQHLASALLGHVDSELSLDPVFVFATGFTLLDQGHRNADTAQSSAISPSLSLSYPFLVFVSLLSVWHPVLNVLLLAMMERTFEVIVSMDFARWIKDRLPEVIDQGQMLHMISKMWQHHLCNLCPSVDVPSTKYCTMTSRNVSEICHSISRHSLSIAIVSISHLRFSIYISELVSIHCNNAKS